MVWGQRWRSYEVEFSAKCAFPATACEREKTGRRGWAVNCWKYAIIVSIVHVLWDEGDRATSSVVFLTALMWTLRYSLTTRGFSCTRWSEVHQLNLIRSCLPVVSHTSSTRIATLQRPFNLDLKCHAACSRLARVPRRPVSPASPGVFVCSPDTCAFTYPNSRTDKISNSTRPGSGCDSLPRVCALSMSPERPANNVDLLPKKK